MLIARLIAEPDDLSEKLERARAAMEGRGLKLASAAMLDFCSETMQLGFPGDDADGLREVVDEVFGRSDLLVADHEPLVPRVFVSDMDSTMIAAECIDELADFAGIKDRIADITERAMRGELDFEAALRERVGLLEGLSEAAINECLETRIAMMPGARTLVQTLKDKGCRTILVTGGFHQFADPVAEQLGFDEVVANRLEVAGGKLTGGLDGPITDSSVKKRSLLDAMNVLGDGAMSLALGDGANDIPMIEAATYGIAYRAKPKARAAADGWIDRGDLTAILQLLGIKREEWTWD
ncbi:phosphoserine phosphatase SerB [Novosphingobium marinum]|uniref:Phosphoserine phosphatase n=1 Tax=Novosphingobium marinum TaxID=1514948 RepID=A0A7Z0BTI8_9SPHN|nr:phosphoserine phosphatase SerB [Novosphingobium marinum]NYH94128.1 phosphoserine phosphatase [Novosphingobium marinum]GGC19792.1 phosphoserine phosphatase SerB [Novosphingobium marinum]